MKISIIIPTWQEGNAIGELVSYLVRLGTGHQAEIIVSDGGSSDNTIIEAQKAGAIALTSPVKGRAVQMNYAASVATGDILYFVHADTLPPTGFITDILAAVNEGYGLGRYRTKFKSAKFLLRLNAFFTRFDLFICYGGDQTLFITRDLFEKIKGFDPTIQLMEDYDIVKRARALAKYKIMRKSALISARKYDNNSWWTVQWANYTMVKMFKAGFPQADMVKRYKEMLAPD